VTILVWVKRHGWTILDDAAGLLYCWGADEEWAAPLPQPFRRLWGHAERESM